MSMWVSVRAAAEVVDGHRDSRIKKKVQNVQRDTPDVFVFTLAVVISVLLSSCFFAFCAQRTALTTGTTCLLYISAHLGCIFLRREEKFLGSSGEQPNSLSLSLP